MSPTHSLPEQYVRSGCYLHADLDAVITINRVLRRFSQKRI